MDEKEKVNDLRAAQAGDRLAGSRVFRVYHERIFAYFRRLCGNEPDAEDLTQRAFCKAWTALPQFREESSFSTWLHGISYRVFLDWLRRPDGSDRTVDRSHAWWDEIPEDALSPFENAVEQELAASVYRVVNTLDRDLQQVVHLHYYQGLTVAEMAEVTCVPMSTLKYRLRSARDRIRALLRQKRTELKEIAR